MNKLWHVNRSLCVACGPIVSQLCDIDCCQMYARWCQSRHRGRKIGSNGPETGEIGLDLVAGCA